MIIAEDLANEPKSIINEAKETAAAILGAAHKEAESILNGAEEMAEEISGNAKEAGYDEGYKEGSKAGLTESKSAAAAAEKDRQAAFESILKEIRDIRENVYESLNNEIRELVFDIVKKVLGRLTEEDESIFRRFIGEAVARMHPHGEFTVTVSKENALRYFPEGYGEFTVDGSSVTAVVLPDEDLAGWGAAIKDTARIADAGLEDQLANIKFAFERITMEKGT